MWYTDPTLALPALMAILAFLTFILMFVAGILEHKWIAGIFGAFWGFFTATAVFGFTFGYYLRHSEEVNKWIGIM